MIVVHKLALCIVIIEAIVLAWAILKVLDVALLFLFHMLLVLASRPVAYCRAPLRFSGHAHTMEPPHVSVVGVLVQHRVSYELHAVLQVDIVLHRCLVELLQDGAHVIHFTQRLQKRNVVIELTVVDIVVPRDNGKGVIRLEQVGRWRVVDDENVSQVAAQFGKVLDVHALIEGAMVS